MLDAGNGFDVQAGWPTRLGLLIAFSLACLVPADVAFARRERKERNDAPAAQAAANAAPGTPTTLTKTLAIDAIIRRWRSIAVPPKRKKRSSRWSRVRLRSAATQAGVPVRHVELRLAVARRPEDDAFLLRIFTDPDQAVRPGDQGVYPAADLRTDTAHVMAKVGSPDLRLQLAKLYTQSTTPPAVRSAIEQIIRTPAPANFAAQVEVFRGAEATDTLKDALQKILIEKNASAVKLASASRETHPGKRTPPPATHFRDRAMVPVLRPIPPRSWPAWRKCSVPREVRRRKPGSPVWRRHIQRHGPGQDGTSEAAMQKAQASAGSTTKPGKPGAAPRVPATPEVMALEIMGQIQSLQPIDPGLVARDLWQPDFVDAIAKKLSDSKADEAIISALASLPTKSAREKLREILHKDRNKGPDDLGKVETVDTAAAAPSAASSAAGTRRRGGKRQNGDDGGFENATKAEKPRGTRTGFNLQLPGKAEAKKELVEFGNDWYDPGSLVVLKTVVPYNERPPEKPTHHSTCQPQRMRMSAAMEKRLHDKAEKQKVLDATYDWRDAIEKSVRQWDDRLAAVAEEPRSGGRRKHCGADDKAMRPPRSRRNAST